MDYKPEKTGCINWMNQNTCVFVTTIAIVVVTVGFVMVASLSSQTESIRKQKY